VLPDQSCEPRLTEIVTFIAISSVRWDNLLLIDINYNKVCFSRYIRQELAMVGGCTEHEIRSVAWAFDDFATRLQGSDLAILAVVQV